MHLGLPVVPDEYRMYSGCSKGSGANDAARPLTPNSCQRLARLAAAPSAASGGCGSTYGITTTCSTAVSCASASDMGCSESSCLPAQKEPSAVNRTVG